MAKTVEPIKTITATFTNQQDLRPEDPEIFQYRVLPNDNPEHPTGFAYDVCNPSSQRYDQFRSGNKAWATQYYTEQEAEALALHEIEEWSKRCSWTVVAERID
jgi:hypothetical protein